MPISSRRVHVPAGLGEDRRHVTHRTLRLAVEHRRAACRSRGIETSRRRRGRRNRELIKLKRRKFCGDQIGIATHVAKTFARRDREFHRIVQTRIVKRSLPVHLEIRDERIPVRD